jgi:hypothetical protein
MSQHKLLWGDFHTHLVDFDNGDAILRDARENIDFCAVLCYPFVWEWKNGIRVESVRNRPEFAPWWERLRTLARAHHEPGRFVTLLGFEWPGNRTHYGDHNVIYFDDDGPLDDAWTLEELYANLRKTRAFAIPHHTGYFPHRRGKDWDVLDEALSPVMEVFSIHGSSEGCNTPRPMESNSSMGPRASGGTFHDALARGHRIGIIASNDYEGLPGRWGIGRAAVWADDCTREAIWDAVMARRTYAVTGDRIELDFRINGQPMGSVIQADGTVDAEVSVVGAHAIDRIELLHNGRLADTYCHSGANAGQRRPACKVFIQAGWGPAERYGFKPKNIRWRCRLDVEGGSLLGVERCFTNLGQRVTSQDARHCACEFVTTARRKYKPDGMTQGIVVEIQGRPDTRLRLQVDDVRTDGFPLHLTIDELLRGGRMVPLIEESERRIRDTFGVAVEDLINPDPVYHNARKVKLHQAIPEAAYRVSHTFRSLPLTPGPNAFYAAKIGTTPRPCACGQRARYEALPFISSSSFQA